MQLNPARFLLAASVTFLGLLPWWPEQLRRLDFSIAVLVLFGCQAKWLIPKSGPLRVVHWITLVLTAFAGTVVVLIGLVFALWPSDRLPSEATGAADFLMWMAIVAFFSKTWIASVAAGGALELGRRLHQTRVQRRA